MKILLALLVLTSCRTAPKPEAAPSARPPATTREACDAFRAYFEKYGHRSVSPRDVTTECHMRITAESRRSGPLKRHLLETGWRQDTAHPKGSIPAASAWETPSTRCVLEEFPESGNDVRGGIGISGGGGVSTGFGIGLGIGSGGEMRDYKIDCADKPAR
jgi:hypothetical protein